MTPLVWANFPLALLFILAIVGIPAWMIYKRVDRAPDHSEAHAYLRAKAEAERISGPGAAAPAQVTTMAAAAAPPARQPQGRWRTAGPRGVVPGRRHSAAARGQRTHTREAAPAAGRRTRGEG
ncbi:MAG: hypothetical protein ACM32E_33210 [Gemmatimonadota bacterium]